MKIFELIGSLIDECLSESPSIFSYRSDNECIIECNDQRMIKGLILPVLNEAAVEMFANSEWWFLTITVSDKIKKIVLQNDTGMRIEPDCDALLDEMYEQGVNDLYLQNCHALYEIMSMHH